MIRQGTAVVTRPAETAPVATSKFAFIVIRQLGGRREDIVCPGVEFFTGDLRFIDCRQPGLVDNGTDAGEVVQVAEKLTCAEGIDAQLGRCRRDRQLAELEITDDDGIAADDDTVARAEAVLHIRAHVQPLFHKD